MPESSLPLTLEDLDYDLPPELIADRPSPQRDHSRLLAVSRRGKSLQDRYFYELPEFFQPGDTIIFNNTRVLKARLLCKTPSGKDSDILLIERVDNRRWKAMVRYSRKFKNGQTVDFPGLTARIGERVDDSLRVIEFDRDITFEDIERVGVTPLPPYIVEKRVKSAQPGYRDEDAEWYQSIFARYYGSVAAPTASLHFTPEIVEQLKAKKVDIAYVTLHVGPGTFKPIDRPLEDFHIHSEWVEVPAGTLELIRETKKRGGKVTAVGTTVTRALESAERAVSPSDSASSFQGYSELFIHPPFDFLAVDRLITNFHLPRSTLLMLVYAFAGQDLIRSAYRHAIQEKYRFYSYGDAMLLD